MGHPTVPDRVPGPVQLTVTILGGGTQTQLVQSMFAIEQAVKTAFGDREVEIGVSWGDAVS